jgi:hypothetical protein
MQPRLHPCTPPASLRAHVCLTGPGSGPGRTRFSLVLAPAAVGHPRGRLHALPHTAPYQSAYGARRRAERPHRVTVARYTPFKDRLPTLRRAETATFYMATRTSRALGASRRPPASGCQHRPRAPNQPSISGSTRRQPFQWRGQGSAGARPVTRFQDFAVLHPRRWRGPCWHVLAPFDLAKLSTGSGGRDRVGRLSLTQLEHAAQNASASGA